MTTHLFNPGEFKNCVHARGAQHRTPKPRCSTYFPFLSKSLKQKRLRSHQFAKPSGLSKRVLTRAQLSMCNQPFCGLVSRHRCRYALEFMCLGLHRSLFARRLVSRRRRKRSMWHLEISRAVAGLKMLRIDQLLKAYGKFAEPSVGETARNVSN